jgi:hypothetical protein
MAQGKLSGKKPGVRGCAMKPNLYSRRNEAREERKRQTLAAGLMSERFPDVASIVVTMNYKRGSFPWVLRTLNFYPGSPAFFRISCLGEGCDEGGLDLTHPIQRMIRSHEKSKKGELSCDNKDAAIVHPSVDYEVAITYS